MRIDIRRTGRTFYTPRRLSYIRRAVQVFRRTGHPLPFPLHIQVQTQSHCKGKCRCCPWPETAAKLPQGRMSDGFIQRLFSEMAVGNEFHELILMLQNEPLLDTRLLNVINWFKSSNPERLCRVVTNGEKLADLDLDAWSASGLNELVVSLNADREETFQSLHCGIDYQKVLQGIETVLHHPGLAGRLILGFFVCRSNELEVWSAVRRWTRRGIRCVLFPVSNRGGALQDARLDPPLKPPLSWKIKQWLSDMVILRGFGVCPLPFYSLPILWNGDTPLCCNDWWRRAVTGNLRRRSIVDLWDSPEINSFRRLMIAGRYQEIETCRECSLARLFQ